MTEYPKAAKPPSNLKIQRKVSVVVNDREAQRRSVQTISMI